ncbi:anti-anti-sigma factor [Amycolatopsis xylanica]|uniref:Anti-sigma factor antagonist n=1 Tax=Amycolatopsis xylanica TaxID=589385 RepID=A0A1H3JW22_9PSEU|nr:STAS domain-containing protein [Amycolatopsis xylanica]SDY44142.1 anti-anti-sigma factor [Amycolatopsis xylanica]
MPTEPVPPLGDEVLIQVSRVNAVCVVAIFGEVDLVSAGTVRQALVGELEPAPDGLVADLSGVTFFGSSGLSALVEADERAKQLSVSFATVAARREVLVPLRVTGLDELLAVHPTVDEAVRAIATPD